MSSKQLIFALPAAVIVLASHAAIAGKTLDHVGKIVCATDKWDEKEPTKGHKLADATTRCVNLPDDASAPKIAEACTGKYEYMPDGSWKASGTCTDTYPGGDKIHISWEEGSHLKEYTYKNTGGTGKFEGVTGGGTYFYEPLGDGTLFAGWYKGKVVLP